MSSCNEIPVFPSLHDIYCRYFRFQVRQEASKCPDIVIAPNLDADKRSSSQNYFVASDSPLKAPPGLEPSIQWQIKQILEFSKLRCAIGESASCRFCFETFLSISSSLLSYLVLKEDATIGLLFALLREKKDSCCRFWSWLIDDLAQLMGSEICNSMSAFNG